VLCLFRDSVCRFIFFCDCQAKFDYFVSSYVSVVICKQAYFQDSYGVWKGIEKIGHFPAWKSLEKSVWSVRMEKVNNFLDLIF